MQIGADIYCDTKCIIRELQRRFPSPTLFPGSAEGMAWGVGGWLLPNFLAKAGMEVAGRLRARVAKELTTSFASNYTNEISLSEALDVDTMQQYYAKHTGEKFLVCPQK